MFRKYSISDSLEVYKSEYFPMQKKATSTLRHTATVGLGGNVGDVKHRFHHLLFALARDKRVRVVATSLILKNPPFGYVEQDDFFNSIMQIKTSMQAEEFLQYLLRIEKKYGRKRSFANAPRTLDLDLLFFDNLKMNTKTLTLPHPEWDKRESVLIPLAGLK